jgi:rod shape-determining protein MreB and related proteins
MVVDVGGGTTDVAVLAAGRIVQARSLKVAGNAMDEAIVRHVRRSHRLLIGEGTAERIKIEAGTALAAPNGRDIEIHIKGRDLGNGHLKSVVLTPADMAEALALPVAQMAEFIRRALEDLAPDTAADVTARDIVLTGGGALLDRLDGALQAGVGTAFRVPDTPTHCVIKGCAAVLESLALRRHLLVGP